MNARRTGLVALVALAAAAPAPALAAKDAKLTAQITRTKYGVPHVKAATWQGLGFGYAYAFAEDNICTIADSYVTVNAERSLYFGPDESWTFSGNGAVNDNLDSDFFYARVNQSGIVEDLLSRPPPEGPAPQLRKLVKGYVAGYNEYLRATGVERIPDQRCRGADWVRPITELDVYRRFHQLGSLASSGAAITGIGTAAPVIAPARAEAAERAQRESVDAIASGEAEDFFPLDSSSNAIGLGSEATASGKGMVLGNPHFPWDGAERLYQAQLTIPGKLDVSGGSLYGVPAVLIGQNRHLAWSHTVASAWRFTPFELTLVPGDPHSYLVDGQPKQMRAVELTVEVRNDAGAVEERTRTLYETEYGPMVTSVLGLPLFPWTPLKGYALGDVNFENFRYLNHFLATDRARSVREYDRIGREIQGIPWVNSIAADRKGRAYYSMDGAIPNVPDAKATGCAGALGVAVFPLTGIPILDGSRSECGWDTDPDAVIDGIFGPSAIPRLVRRDYVENGNDSHWLSNPHEPLTGFARVIGDEATSRSLRTRIGLLMIEQRLAGDDGLRGKGFTLRKLAKVALGNRQYAGELWRDELVAFCEQSPTLAGTAGPVDVSGACPVLAAWDLRDDLDSAGRDPLPSLRLQPARQLPIAAERRLEQSGGRLGGRVRRSLLERRPGQHAARAEHRQPAGRPGARRCGQRPRRRRHPARRHPARVPVRDPRRQADPDPRRPGHPRRVQRDQRPLGRGCRLSERPPRDLVHRRDDLGRARLSGPPAELRDLQPVRGPGLAARARLHAGVLAQAMEQAPVLCRRRARAGGRARARRGALNR